VSSHSYVVSNPRNSRRDILIFWTDSDGDRKQIARLRPGQSRALDRDDVQVERRPVPVKLVSTGEGSYRKDHKLGAGPRSRRADAVRREDAETDL